MKITTIQGHYYLYLAAGLFNAGERLHNLHLERALSNLGWTVVLPQRKALEHFRDGAFDIFGIVDSCQQQCTQSNCIYVGNVDGADADSGTCVEFGMAVQAGCKHVVFRTDFRTALEAELGVNAMLRPAGTPFVYVPCFFTKLDEVDEYYGNLALKIHQAIAEIFSVSPPPPDPVDDF